jgi:anti-sigma B factor antagonist
MNLVITSVSPKSTLISFSNESLDAGNAKAFRDEIAPVLETADTLFLDMSRLSFVDSSGLGSLLSCLRTMNAKEGSMRLFGITKPVMALFELVRMHRLFSIYLTKEDAEQDIQQI